MATPIPHAPGITRVVEGKEERGKKERKKERERERERETERETERERDSNNKEFAQ